ncbi:MAG: FimB/Mfa2 family fimbrial subunit [Muribaculaceae bacterium]|nr:FimB/Mfa2 family fimbrial subunit [Muribaculaceae bacterium]MDE6768151.1 FimB/Mfa2 family fimbrial subunit [Muribaculaceae bacterium]
MNKNFCKTSTAWLAAMALMPLSACSDMADSDQGSGKGDGDVVIPKFVGIPYLNSSDDEADKLSEVNVFHFKGEDFFLKTDVTDPYAETVELPTNGTTRVYCVAGLPLSPEEGTKEEDFSKSVVESPANAQSAPLFYSGVADFSEDNLRGGRVEINLTRGVARIDFTNAIEGDVKIQKIIVENAPASTFVFANDSIIDEATVTYSHEFSESPTETQTGVFTLFESSKPVNIRILGEYGDTPINLITALPKVERNKVYTLQTVTFNSLVQGAFTVKDWETAGSTDAKPSTSYEIFIDELNSVIPEDVVADYAHNTLTVPYTGAKMKVAFVAPTKVSVASVEGEQPTVKITPNEPLKVEEGYISSFNITVDNNKRLAYNVVINLKDETGKYNFLEIKVLNNTVRTIDTVKIAGAEWMAFNCTGPDLDKQIYPVDGLSIEETYRNNWVGAAGALFQFGRQYAYTPYIGYNPCNNLGDQAQDMPWVNYSHMPCPEGYHVATLEEFRTLCPNGTVIPGTYTAGNGESITVTIHKIDEELYTPTKVGGVGRYMKFKSNDTGNVLILPIAGYKGDKSKAANPTFGKDAVYWTNSNISCWGGHARAFRFMFNWGDEAKMEEFQFAMEAFAYVRAIKNVEPNEE